MKSKITIDSDEKLVAYSNFHDYARKLPEISIKINALAKQVNLSLFSMEYVALSRVFCKYRVL